MEQATSRAEGVALANKHGPVTTDDGLDKWVCLVCSYFRLDGHHVQFNVVIADTLRKAQAQLLTLHSERLQRPSELSPSTCRRYPILD